jgi:hypothetical protein
MHDLNAILNYLNAQSLVWELTLHGSFDYVELMIMHECVNFVVTKEPRITFELEDDIDGHKYTLDEVDMPGSLALVSHLNDGWLLLRFHPVRDA